MQTYGINTRTTVAAFLAQTAHETDGFSRMRENLNYGADGLRNTWPKRFTAVQAIAYARNPEKIADYVYAERDGNGPEESGDGWLFRGGGGLMLTGRDNYRDYGLEDDPDKISEPEHAMMSAGWFWSKKKLNVVSDFAKITRIINGGMVGYEDRKSMFEKAKSVLGVV